MKFLFLEDALSSRMGGMELAMFAQCVQLRNLGHDVTVGYRRPGDLLASYHGQQVSTIRLHSYAPTRRRALREGGGFVIDLVRCLPLPMDLIVANSYHATLFGAAIARTKRIPLVCHLRLNPPVAATAPIRLGLRNVSCFIAASESVRRLWIARGVDPRIIEVVHEGIDTDRFRPSDSSVAVRTSLGLSAEDFVILSAGRIDPVKDLEGLLDSFAIVANAHDRARLVIAGTPSSFSSPVQAEIYLASLKARAQHLGVAQSVLWTGHWTDMPGLYSAADVVALFGAIPEPFGLVSCEALACGRPMVTPDQGGSSEILTGEFSRFLFRPGDHEEAARLMLNLVGWQYRDPGFVARARAHVRANFDLSRMGARMEGAFMRARSAGPVRAGPDMAAFKPVRRVGDTGAVAPETAFASTK